MARRDVPLARARVFQFSMPFFRGVAEAALYCAHRATTVSSWGLCEQESHLAAPLYPSEAARCASTEDHRPPSLPPFCEQEGHLAAPPLSFTARIERPSSFQIILPSLLAFSSREGGLFGLPLRAAFSPSHPLARRDVPLARASTFRFSPLALKGSSQTVLHCAH